jgi:hypothetical protein
MKMRDKDTPLQGIPASELVKNRQAIAQLAHSGDAQKLMTMLQQQGGVEQAAQAAAKGDTSQLVSMVKQLTQTKEGAALVEQLQTQAKQAGL